MQSRHPVWPPWAWAVFLHCALGFDSFALSCPTQQASHCCQRRELQVLCERKTRVPLSVRMDAPWTDQG